VAANSTKEALGLDQNRVLSTDSVVTLENFQISVPKSGSSIDGVPSALLTLAAGKSETGVQREPTFEASQEFPSSSPDRSLPPLVQFGHSSVPETREQSFNRGRMFSWLTGS